MYAEILSYNSKSHIGGQQKVVESKNLIWIFLCTCWIKWVFHLLAFQTWTRKHQIRQTQLGSLTFFQRYLMKTIVDEIQNVHLNFILLHCATVWCPWPNCPLTRGLKGTITILNGFFFFFFMAKLVCTLHQCTRWWCWC